MANRHKDLCWGTSRDPRLVKGKSETYTRQRRRHRALKRELEAVKNQFGHGEYSWAAGMTRRAARKIARVRARRAQ